MNLLVFGVFDFLNDMHLEYVENGGVEYSYARAKIPVDAKAAGVAAIDAIWQKVDDVNGLINDTILAKRLGYVGKVHRFILLRLNRFIRYLFPVRMRWNGPRR